MVTEMVAAGVAYVVNLDAGWLSVLQGEGLRPRRITIKVAISSIPRQARERIAMFTCPFISGALPVHSLDFGQRVAGEIDENVK